MKYRLDTCSHTLAIMLDDESAIRLTNAHGNLINAKINGLKPFKCKLVEYL